MHEYSIVASLVDRVEREARSHGATAVHRLHLRVGEYSGVEIDLLETAYRTFREHTVCAGAALQVERVAAVWGCPACQRTLGSKGLGPGGGLRCPTCGRPARLDQGDEIILERIEMEVA